MQPQWDSLCDVDFKTDVAVRSRATPGYQAIVVVNFPCIFDTTVWHVGRKVRPSTYDLLS